MKRDIRRTTPSCNTLKNRFGICRCGKPRGRGNDILLVLPCITYGRETNGGSIPGNEKPSGGTETILFIEDEYLILKVIRRLLKSYGYSVYVAADGEEALEVFARHRDEIALVLSDVGLPKMSGIDIFKKLKEMDIYMKVVLASGFFEPDLKFSLHQQGVKGFIQKPYSNDEVLQKLREVLDEKSTS